MQAVQDKLNKLSAQIPVFEGKVKGMDLPKEEGRLLAPHVRDIADLGVEIRKLNGEVDGLGNGMDDTLARLDELRKMKSKSAEKEAFDRMDELRNAGRAKDNKNDAKKDTDEEGLKLRASLRDLDDLNKELIPVEKKIEYLIRVTGTRLQKDKKSTDGIVRDARGKVNVADRHGKDMVKKLEPIAHQINTADPEKLGPVKSNEQIKKALDSLEKLKPELGKLEEE